MDLLKLFNYSEQHSDTEPDLLAELNRETHLKVLQPRMLSGHYQGRLLSLLSRMIQPETILEIGTFTGYSALCMAEGLTPNGKLFTIEINDELEPISGKYFNRSTYKQQIHPLIGDAIEVIPTLKETFDLSFLDGDKEQYLNYYELVLNKTKAGGFILADNVWWSGKVLENAQTADKPTKAILEFNAAIKNDTRVSAVMLPIRDGLTMIQKK